MPPTLPETVSSETASPQTVHLAVDLGASSGRVVAGELVDDRLEMHVVHRFPNDPVHLHGSMQWNVLGLWAEIERGLAKAAAQFDSVASVGVDSWGVDYALLTPQDQIAGPVWHYRDGRNVGMMAKAFERVGRDEIFAGTGLQFMEINTLFQLLSARLSGDPNLIIANGFVMIGDLFHWMLSGVRSVEITNASTTQLLDPKTRQWNGGLIQKLDLPGEVLGELVQPGTTLGNVTAEVARRTGLVDVPVVVPATHDTASAVLAVPANNFAPENPNWCYISSGTWSLMGCELPEPMVNDRCAELNFTNEGGVSGSTRLLKNIGGLWIFQQIRAAMIRRGTERTWDEMVQMAAAADPFGCLIHPDDPAFLSPEDMVDAIAQRASETGQTAPADQNGTHEGVLYRSALEGLALRYRQCLGMLEELVGNPIQTIHIVGGGSVNELLCQMTADACDRTVIAGPVEATAIGNLMMQMIGTGRLESVNQGRDLVRASFDTKTFKPNDPAAWDAAATKFNEFPF